MARDVTWAIFILRLVIRILVIGIFVIRRQRKVRIFFINSPAVGFIKVFEFPLHIFKDFVLKGSEPLLPTKHRMIRGEEHIETDELPFCDALRLLYIRERVAGKGLFAVGSSSEKFTVFTLNHILCPAIKKLKKFCFTFKAGSL
jgi:hypothetical protein